ncbi:MAG TPA: CehA/McbA family metallohydrolase [Levilinea sp.]|nr:CehA/McbA family metallohydrolase [Levilinea sp.]
MNCSDGPASPYFTALRLPAIPGGELVDPSEALKTALKKAPHGRYTAWGIPFEINQPLALADTPVEIMVSGLCARWLVFLHTTDLRPNETNPAGFISPMRGEGQLNEHAATYNILYTNGQEARAEVRRRHQVGMFDHRWGEQCFQCVPAPKPRPKRLHHEQPTRFKYWGLTQTRIDYDFDEQPLILWLWAWENPFPEREICGVRFEPVSGTTLLLGISAGSVLGHPLRWQPRQKALLTLPEGTAFEPDLNEKGLLAQIQLDQGQVISAQPAKRYPNDAWESSYDNQLPQVDNRRVLVEYSAHPEACFHLWDGSVIPVVQVESEHTGLPVQFVPAARQRVTLRVHERGSSRSVAVKLHLHGQHGEYLAPVDRHRIANPAWFEDYSADFMHAWNHPAAYIDGETIIDLPLGKVYAEISKGFEIRPLHTVLEISPDTETITIELDRVLPWRERGWVTADTHVHFLSPMSALLEGAAEGVNVVNLLASQWGELMTNVGDFDGRNTWGAKETGGEGEYLVRVGSENRQHVLGHISLLGYHGRIISPMTTGGPDESAIGDPVELLLTEWARQCRRQGGLVVLPHFPNPRAEHAAAIVSGDVDALEMTSWGNLYGGIDPYSLSDWYRYLNCGYLVPAVGGTDKMSADTAVGTVRTYARLLPGELFTYDSWMAAVRRAETFVTYGPLLEFTVEGRPMGSRIPLPASGGTVDIAWQVASVTTPVSRVELVVNGEIRESTSISAENASGAWSLHVERSAWAALLVRGHYPDKPEIITAHSTPVMLEVEGSPVLAAADAVTILEQIEGAMAYIDTVGTRANDRAYKRMRLVLEGAHRNLHNRMHRLGYYHNHTPPSDHAVHH